MTAQRLLVIPYKYQKVILKEFNRVIKMRKFIFLQLLLSEVSCNKLKAVQTNFVATDPFCESNVVFPDALSDTCTGRTFQDGKSCHAQCLEKVVLTCSCMNQLFGVIWVAKPDGCEWEIDGVCEREIVKKQATANFKVETIANTGKFFNFFIRTMLSIRGGM